MTALQAWHHACHLVPSDELRDKLVPFNKKCPLKELLQARCAYLGLSNAKRITFE
jgi:adenine C2-methylase RlmN of 23S rRNA A2503 and tRNA A37